MAKETASQKNTVGRVMHEFKHGELKSNGGKVKDRKQAVAIALHEAGASNQESAKTNRKNLNKTKARERQDRTGQAQAEGRGKPGTSSRAALYSEARKRDIPGRSKMSKAQLEHALH